jgi:hypothetical protein
VGRALTFQRCIRGEHLQPDFQYTSQKVRVEVCNGISLPFGSHSNTVELDEPAGAFDIVACGGVGFGHDVFALVCVEYLAVAQLRHRPRAHPPSSSPTVVPKIPKTLGRHDGGEVFGIIGIFGQGCGDGAATVRSI